MSSDLDKSPYSRSFKILLIMGAWTHRDKDEYKMNLRLIYSISLLIFFIYGIYLLLKDLYLVFGDLNKMSWNLCTTLIFSATLLKNILLFTRSEVVNYLRESLHRAAEKRKHQKHIMIHDHFLKEYKYLRGAFYTTFFVFVPTWLLIYYFSYLWGPREWPIPARLPIDVDPEDEVQYNVIFVMYAFLAMSGLIYIVEIELSLFSILLQLSREFKVLVEDIPELNNEYEERGGNYKFIQEPNPILKTMKTKKIIKKLFVRLQRIVRLTMDFEKCFSSSMLIQLIGASVLATVSGIQCIVALEDSEFSINLSYQLGYVSIIIFDVFLLGLFSTRLKTLCEKIGEEVYFTRWYEMDLALQKDICMIIRRSQNFPKITMGKIMELDLNAFMHIMRNIYSGLTLYQQLESTNR